MASITSANSTWVLNVGVWRAASGLNSVMGGLGALSNLVSAPIEIKRFDADVMFETSTQEMVETKQPIDGGDLAVGWLATGQNVTLTGHLMADSDTITALGALYDIQNQARETLKISATIDAIGQGKRYILEAGAFSTWTVVPTHRKTVESVEFGFIFSRGLMAALT